MRRRARAAEKPMKLTVANGARSLSASRWKVGNTRSGADMHRPGQRGLLFGRKQKLENSEKGGVEQLAKEIFGWLTCLR